MRCTVGVPVHISSVICTQQSIFINLKHLNRKEHNKTRNISFAPNMFSSIGMPMRNVKRNKQVRTYQIGKFRVLYYSFKCLCALIWNYLHEIIHIVIHLEMNITNERTVWCEKMEIICQHKQLNNFALFFVSCNFWILKPSCNQLTENWKKSKLSLISNRLFSKSFLHNFEFDAFRVDNKGTIIKFSRRLSNLPSLLQTINTWCVHQPHMMSVFVFVLNF